MNNTKSILFVLLLILGTQIYQACILGSRNNNILLSRPATAHADTPVMAKKNSPLPESFPATSIRFNETEHNFGIIPDNKNVYTRFHFKNGGPEPLMIISAEGSCGCTVPQWPQHAIAPGDSAFIEVAFDPKGKRNETTKVITVTSNTKPSGTILIIRANVVKSG